MPRRERLLGLILEKCTKKDHSVTTSPHGRRINSRHMNQIYLPTSDNDPVTFLNLRRLPGRVDYHDAGVLLHYESPPSVPWLRWAISSRWAIPKARSTNTFSARQLRNWPPMNGGWTRRPAPCASIGQRKTLAERTPRPTCRASAVTSNRPWLTPPDDKAQRKRQRKNRRPEAFCRRTAPIKAGGGGGGQFGGKARGIYSMGVSITDLDRSVRFRVQVLRKRIRDTALWSSYFSGRKSVGTKVWLV
jgi:hypothetical protein